MKKALFILVALLVVSVTLLLKWIGPYGPEYLPQWVKFGNELVQTIEAFKEKQGAYPDNLPIEADLKLIPGCRKIEYKKHSATDWAEYFTIRMLIHRREAVIYDSRKNLDESSSWGTYRILDDWMWTKD